VAFSFGIDQFKGGFFDADAVLKEMDKVERKTLSRFGAFTRQRIKSSLKYQTGKSSPGKPPHVHKTRGFNRVKKDKKTGTSAKQPVSPLRELVYFAYDAATHSVVTGPVKFGGRGGVAPGLLEAGGPGTFKDAESGEIKRGVWAPRPFVKPAGDAEVQAGRFLKG
jgi:hypothetical protein